jgi:hypothetical protein
MLKPVALQQPAALRNDCSLANAGMAPLFAALALNTTHLHSLCIRHKQFARFRCVSFVARTTLRVTTCCGVLPVIHPPCWYARCRFLAASAA